MKKISLLIISFGFIFIYIQTADAGFISYPLIISNSGVSDPDVVYDPDLIPLPPDAGPDVGPYYPALIIYPDKPNIVYDTLNKKYWIKDLNLLTGKTFGQMLNTIESWNQPGHALYFEDLNPWKMASYNDMVELWAYTAEDLMTAFDKNQSGTGLLANNEYWTGVYDEKYPGHDEAHYLTGIGKLQTGNIKLDLNTYPGLDSSVNPGIGAWVVTHTTPIPSSGWLLASCAIIIIGLRRRLGIKDN